MTEPSSAAKRSEAAYASELFVVRMWREPVDEHWEWRGKVQRVTTGEIRYFREWKGLLATLQEMLPAPE